MLNPETQRGVRGVKPKRLTFSLASNTSISYLIDVAKVQIVTTDRTLKPFAIMFFNHSYPPFVRLLRYNFFRVHLVYDDGLRPGWAAP